jgi:hypothetical protein
MNIRKTRDIDASVPGNGRSTAEQDASRRNDRTRIFRGEASMP